jgi:hypothetical protein
VCHITTVDLCLQLIRTLGAVRLSHYVLEILPLEVDQIGVCGNFCVWLLVRPNGNLVVNEVYFLFV